MPRAEPRPDRGKDNDDAPPADPLVSIVIPFYDVEAYLGECLESVCAQSYGAIEVILVDDGSTDLSQHPRPRVAV